MNAPLRAFLKSLYGTVFPFFYRKVEITGMEHIPANGPVMLCANHSNAFLDPLLIGVPFPRHLWYLARGDVFKGAMVNRVLHALGILPIYRQQEGADNLEKNAEVFETCYRFLGRGGAIGIFPEGNAERENHLRPLKKGAARIVLGAIQSGHIEGELYIIPAGINYEYPDHFASRLHLRYGKPILVSEFISDGEVLSPRNVNLLSKAIRSAMAEVHIHIDDKFSQRAFFFLVNQYDVELKMEERSGDDYFQALQRSATRWNEKSAIQDAGLHQFILFEQVLHGIHKQHRILPAVMLNKLTGAGAMHKFPNVFVVLLGLALWLPGFFFNLIPFRIPYLLARKKVKKAEFFNSVNVVSAGIIFLLWYGITFLLMSSFMEPAWLRIIILGGLFMSGWFALRIHHALRRLESVWKWSLFSRKHPQRVSELRSQALEVHKWVKDFAATVNQRAS